MLPGQLPVAGFCTADIKNVGHFRVNMHFICGQNVRATSLSRGRNKKQLLCGIMPIPHSNLETR